MSILKRADPGKLDSQVVAYVSRRTGQFVCREHGEHDIESPHSEWAAVRLVDRCQASFEATTPVICHECCAWLNDESTGYAIAWSQDGYWKRRLRAARGHQQA
jgi:hypothetical protein